MPVITFWSIKEKTIGQTVSAALAATVMAMERNYKVLLISADFNNPTLENCFGAQESNKEILKTLVGSSQINLDSGINGLLKLADSNRVTPEIIHDYTKIIFKNRLEVLYSPMNIGDNQKTIVEEYLKNIIVNASRYYDYVFVDLRKGLKFISQLDILNISDVIVANINQEVSTIQEFYKQEKIKTLEPKAIWNICRYDNKSKYNTKNLSRNILKNHAIYEIPYNTLVMEAAQEGSIVELLIRLKTLKDEDENLELIRKIQELVSGILLKYQETRSKM